MADLGFDPLVSTLKGRRLENLPPSGTSHSNARGEMSQWIVCFRPPGNSLCHQGTERASLQRVDPIK
jgi:hypothetical protein